MGTDIHLFIEYDIGEGRVFSRPENIKCVGASEGKVGIIKPAGGRVDIARYRPVFDIFRDVIPARGMPDIYGAVVAWEYLEYCLPKGAYPDIDCMWERGKIEYEISGKMILEGDRSIPPSNDWHSPSYLSFKDLKFCISSSNTAEIHPGNLNKVIDILDVMRELERKYGLGRSRVVFWFDN